jgi:AP-3 complex subunit beta
METGLADTNPLVTGSCLAAFERICPDRLDLIHPHYRRICKSLVDADEWTQVVVLKMMERYARHEFAEPTDTKVSVRRPFEGFAHAG